MSHLNGRISEEMIKVAAETGSLRITQLFLEYEPPGKNTSQAAGTDIGVDDMAGIVSAAIRSGNPELIRYTLTFAVTRYYSRRHSYSSAVYPVLRSSSPEVSAIWQETLDTMNPSAFEDQDLVSQLLVKQYVLLDAAKNPMQEMRLIEVWKMFIQKGRFAGNDLTNGLIAVARWSRSIPQAAFLLEAGASINGRNGGGRSGIGRGMTALHCAARDPSPSENGAQFLKFLLLKGANPLLGYAGSWPAMERGANNIEKWLNMSWEELVHWAREQRGNESRVQSSLTS